MIYILVALGLFGCFHGVLMVRHRHYLANETRSGMLRRDRYPRGLRPNRLAYKIYSSSVGTAISGVVMLLISLAMMIAGIYLAIVA